MSSTIVLLRHARTEMAGRFCGQSDPPLNEQGRLQLSPLANRLARYSFSHIFSSDLLRARETANFVAGSLGLKLELLPELRELRFGEWEGLNWSEISERDPAYARRWIEQYPRIPAPGGEGFAEFRKRVACAIGKIVERIDGGCALVVTHGGVIRSFMMDAQKLPESAFAQLDCDHAKGVEFRWSHGIWELRS